jgi:hypothetical protein
MAALSIDNQQRLIIEKIADDAHLALKDGVEIIPAQPYIPKSDPYNDLINANAANEQKSKDGSKSMAVPIVKNLSTAGASVGNNNPSFNFTSSTLLISTTVSVPSPRKMLVVFNASAYTDVSNTEFIWRLYVSSQAISPDYGFFFNNSGVHHAFGSSWVVDVAAAPSVLVEVRAFRGAGTGNLILDGSDILSLSILG